MPTPADPGRGYWDRLARRYDRATRFISGPIAPMCALIAEALQGAGRVLEVGAGTGLVTPSLARAAREVISTDYAPEMVEVLQERVTTRGLYNVTCAQADLYDLPFAAGSFDAVVAANVLHLVPDLPSALASLGRALKPGGLLIAPTFCHDQTARAWVLSRLFALTGFPGARRFSLVTLQRSLEEAGFTVQRATSLPGPIPIGFVVCVAPSPSVTGDDVAM